MDEEWKTVVPVEKLKHVWVTVLFGPWLLMVAGVAMLAAAVALFALLRPCLPGEEEKDTWCTSYIEER